MTSSHDLADFLLGPEVRQITYPFPLRRDVTVEVRVPTDLTLAEAERIGKFVLTLAVDADEEETK